MALFRLTDGKSDFNIRSINEEKALKKCKKLFKGDIKGKLRVRGQFKKCPNCQEYPFTKHVAGVHCRIIPYDYVVG
jgi:hypothetical protein